MRTVGISGIAAAAAVSGPRSVSGQIPQDAVANDYRIQHGKIRQSVMGWCFKPMSGVELAKHCVKIGMPAIEGISADDYPAVTDMGLEISLVSSHGFKKGPVNPDNHAAVEKTLRSSIDTAVKFKAKRVITFTGMKKDGISAEQSAKNCVACWKRVIKYAEDNGIELVLEHLNSRDDSHPMKGHPGYFGDDVDLCADLIRRVDSPNMKLLFDVYHVQIMNGDVIRRINQYQDIIGHYHTAGNPGRCELDENQEINYPPIMKAILKTGFKGFVAQEFIPTWKNKVHSLRHACSICDVT